MKRWIRTVPRLLLPALLALLAGCAALPDMTPYRDATLQLRSAVVAGGNAVQSSLDSAAASHEADEPTAKLIKEKSDRFRTEWRARIYGADALVAYSEAVTDIVRSATQGAASARSLADALTQLATGVGIALPPASAVATATDAAAFVYGHIAAARAAHSLDQALRSAQPVVDRVATLLSQDLQASLDILRAAKELQLIAISEKYNNGRGYLKALTRERNALYAKGDLTPAEEQRLRKISDLYDATREWREPMDQSIATAEDNYKVRIQLIYATQAAVAEWAAAHRSLAAAVREKRSVNVEALVQATLEAKELVRRLSAL